MFSRGNAAKITVLSIVYFKLDTSSGCQYDSAAFLFSLVNLPGWPSLKLDQTGQYHSTRCSLYGYSSHGPTFGGGSDISIGNNAAASNTNSYSNFGYNYSPPPGNSLGSTFTQSFLAGSYNFRPDEVEVFYETAWRSKSWSLEYYFHTPFSADWNYCKCIRVFINCW